MSTTQSYLPQTIIRSVADVFFLFRQADSSGKFVGVYEHNDETFDFLFAVYPLTRENGEDNVRRAIEICDDDFAVVQPHLSAAYSNYLDIAEDSYTSNTIEGLRDLHGDIIEAIIELLG